MMEGNRFTGLKTMFIETHCLASELIRYYIGLQAIPEIYDGKWNLIEVEPSEAWGIFKDLRKNPNLIEEFQAISGNWIMDVPESDLCMTISETLNQNDPKPTPS